MSVRVGIDTGGTHTDVVLVDGSGGQVLALKVPTTPHDLSQGVLDGLGRVLDDANRPPSSISHFVYATTLVTNLLVEGSDIPVGLITTEGFRDILGIGRASRKPNIYDIQWAPPPPLVPRHLRLVVPERIDARGRVVTPLDEEATRRALGELVAAGVESIAVCFINGYANPEHEQRVAALAAEECPGLGISLSSDVVREFREYERLSTTVVNAYVAPPLMRHIDGLTEKLAGNAVASTPYTMRSNGGIMTFEAAKKLPVTMTHSGPMGGIIGGIAIAAACSIKDIITLDMGGTSADVSLVAGGEPVLTTRGTVGRHPVLLPMLDLITIGAGGGSIAWVDEGGALKVGPRSAGAVPGPACYDQGGDEPTVTDANLVAGRLNADYFLEGTRGLRAERSEAALRDKVAEPLGMTMGEAAIGIMAIAESHMVNAIKLISVERGLDPRDFTLVGFGGCGPLHAARLAEELSIARVLVPAVPGNVSAKGLLSADVRHDMVRTTVSALDDVEPKGLVAEFEDLMESSVAALCRRRHRPRPAPLPARRRSALQGPELRTDPAVSGPGSRRGARRDSGQGIPRGAPQRLRLRVARTRHSARQFAPDGDRRGPAGPVAGARWRRPRRQADRHPPGAGRSREARNGAGIPFGGPLSGGFVRRAGPRQIHRLDAVRSRWVDGDFRRNAQCAIGKKRGAIGKEQ